MATSVFSVTEHVIPAQHIREYPSAVRSEPAALKLAVKEYRPLNNHDATPGSVTIIAAHANGFPKETYEPLWEDLHRAFRGKIRAIWIADCSHQGASGILNENIQGDDPNWFDHSRDLLCMVNHFQSRMPRPIVGIGHSMGTTQLTHLSILHPRLFHSLALLEPIIQPSHPAGPNPALFSSLRIDVWPTRAAASAALQKNRFFASWDRRAFAAYLTHGLRATPTALYPDPAAANNYDNGGIVTLATSKHQEAWSYVRPGIVAGLEPQYARRAAPDLSLANREFLFHRAEMVAAFEELPQVRPRVLWVFGAQSGLNPAGEWEQKAVQTGTGIGGSGGLEAGNVEMEVLEGSHMLPFERVKECATLLSAWLEKQMEDFSRAEEFHRGYDSGKSVREMLAISPWWLKNVKLNPREKRVEKSNL